MSKSRKVLLGAATVAAALSAGDRVEAATANVAVSAVIISAAQIAQTAALDFGTITEVSNGTLPIAGTGTVGAATGGVTAIGGAAAGGVKVKGANGQTLDIVATTNTITIAEGGTDTMGVTNIHIESKAAGVAFPQAVTGAFVSSIGVGGTLVVAGSPQATGTYTGTVGISADYQ